MTNQTLTGITEELLSLERELNLFDIEFDGIQLWRYVRRSVQNRLSVECTTFGRRQVSTEPDGPVARGVRWLRNSVSTNPLLAPESEFLFYGSGRRERRPDGTWWDIHCDPVHDACGIDAVQVEPENDKAHQRPAKTESLYYLDFFELVSGLRRKVGRSDVSLPDRVRRQFSTVADAIRERFGVAIDIVTNVERALTVDRSVRPLYRRLLSRVDPNVAVVVCSYGKETFVDTCRRAGVPVVELQHGIMHEWHLGYHFPGRDDIWGFPDYLFTWGDFWTENASLPIPDERTQPVGYPYLSNLEQQPRDDDAGELLFVSQPGTGDHLSELALGVAENDPPLDIVYRLHPSEFDHWRDRYPSLVGSPIDVRDGTDNLYELFVDATAQVGVSSTALYEGLYYGLPTYIYNRTGAGVMEQLVDAGIAEMVDSAEDLLAELEATPPQFDREWIFVSNPKTRLCERLRAVSLDAT